MYLNETQQLARIGVTMPVQINDANREYVARVIWFLFDRNKDRVITLKWKFVNLNFKVSQLEPVVATFVGPRPASVDPVGEWVPLNG